MLKQVSLLLCLAFGVHASKPHVHHLPSLREQAKIQDGWREERLANIPAILRKHGVDAWIVSQREYGEETVFWSMKQAEQFSARRRTLSIFFADDGFEGCESHTWIDNTPKLWQDLHNVLRFCDPRSIALNIDSEIAFAGGLHAGEYKKLLDEVPAPWNERFVSKPLVAVEYIATMPKSRLNWYRRLMETAWAVIDEGFSERVIVPGQTTTEDVEWWFREKLQSLNYTTWFHPDVTILPGWLTAEDKLQRSYAGKENAIQCGDLLHVDFGLTALGSNTDTQHLAYVLPPGTSESDIPASLLAGLRKGNKLQDIVRSHMIPGHSGNEILHNALESMREANISGKIYSHPIGDWGHSAGTLIGMTNLQDGVPVLGDLPLLKNMYYSVELYVEHWVEERNETIVFPLEEDVYWDSEKKSWEWVWGRQEKFHLVKSEERKEDL
ncbi:hypothetical protein CKM354_000989500 [Cercospora kikuchii]|uniref:Peptidase M24 domain-containing protein n=1 Tax=Cercospora kikuchii TaxID=84275 RepID=A0A9P3CYB5_9PEZI|nr:uncharacterized protein CKM354_000989500 [Cercospora kikuchii]GIZ46783.1 hypothetical protein CKM354_000989500 [Cercospora kikuchii]